MSLFLDLDDPAPADGAPVRWLTYAEAGALLGIDPESVKRRAQRAKWRRMPGNDGRMKIGIPEADLPRAPDAPETLAAAAEEAGRSRTADSLAASLAALVAQAERARHAEDAARGEAIALAVKLAAAQARAGVLEAELRRLRPARAVAAVRTASPAHPPAEMLSAERIAGSFVTGTGRHEVTRRHWRLRLVCPDCGAERLVAENVRARLECSGDAIRSIKGATVPGDTSAPAAA